MGARAQAKVIQDKQSTIYLYSHWDGSDLGNIVKAAMKRGTGRWDDPEYLTRIIFSEMIQNEIMGETGYGIGTEEHGDIEYLIEVDIPKQTVTVGSTSQSFTGFIHD